jgi:hypothetical protein
MIMKRLSLILLGAAVTGLAMPAIASAQSPDSWLEARAQAAEESKPVLVDFYTDW